MNQQANKLGSDELVKEGIVVDELLEVRKVVEMGGPLVADGLTWT